MTNPDPIKPNLQRLAMAHLEAFFDGHVERQRAQLEDMPTSKLLTLVALALSEEDMAENLFGSEVLLRAAADVLGERRRYGIVTSLPQPD